MKLVSALRRLLALSAGAMVIAALSGCASTPLEPQDTALLVTAADLEPFGAPLPADFPRFEHSSKTELLGSIELEYQFDARAAGGAYPYLYSTINCETTVSSAVAAYGAVKAGLGMANIEARDDSQRFRYGDGPLVLNDVNLDIAAGEKVAKSVFWIDNVKTSAQ